MQYRIDCGSRGTATPQIIIVGEAPGENEAAAGVPFIGTSGQELDRMLMDAGIDPSVCRFTNVFQMRPPNNDVDEFFFTSKKASSAAGGTVYNNRYCQPFVPDAVETLHNELRSCRANVIVPVGATALWAVCQLEGITKWRGSEIDTPFGKAIPTYHPAAILRQWENRYIAVQDLRRVKREAETRSVHIPDYNFILRPSVDRVLHCLSDLEQRVALGPRELAVDLETRNRQIACIGLAWSNLDAICIPIQSIDDPQGSYFSTAEETEIIWRLRELLTHPNCHVIGQNFVYDNQYFARNYGFVANLTDDTYIQQSIAFPSMSRGLDFLSSMYREHHLYWKDEGKHWDPKTHNEDQLWEYNCVDAVATYECFQSLEKTLDFFNLRPQYLEKMETARNAFRMMLRGVNSNMQAKLELSSQLGITINAYRHWIKDIIDYDVFGPKGVSSKKMHHLAYGIFKLPQKFVVIKKQRRLTANKEAIAEWLETCEPVFRPVLQAIEDVRSMGVFKSNFADRSLDWDKRFRCDNNVVGAHTMRWSTSEDAFGFGGNLQNIPKGDDR